MTLYIVVHQVSNKYSESVESVEFVFFESYESIEYVSVNRRFRNPVFKDSLLSISLIFIKLFIQSFF